MNGGPRQRGVGRAGGLDLIIAQLYLPRAIKLDHTPSQGQGHKHREFRVCGSPLKIR